MRKEPIKELTREIFDPYGAYASMLNPHTVHIGAKPIEFFRDMLSVDLANSTAASCSVCRVEKRPLIVAVIEFHSRCGEGLLPLDGDVLIHVAPATPQGKIPIQEIEIFRVPQGTLVSLRPGVWHHAPFAYQAESVNVLIILPERTYANDCTVHKIAEEERIEIALS